MEGRRGKTSPRLALHQSFSPKPCPSPLPKSLLTQQLNCKPENAHLRCNWVSPKDTDPCGDQTLLWNVPTVALALPTGAGRGKVILTKAWASGAPAPTHSGWATLET